MPGNIIMQINPNSFADSDALGALMYVLGIALGQPSIE